MWLQDNIFEFVTLDGTKLNLKDITKSLLVVNEKTTETTLGGLFKGSSKEKSSSRLKGFSILEYVNEKGEIEIDKTVYAISFINGEVKFKLNGYVKSQLQRSDKKLSEEEKAIFGKLISDTTSKEDVQVAATAESASTEAEAPKVEAKVEVEVPKIELFNPSEYTDDKLELIEDGYAEYLPEEKSNYRILVKGDKTMVVELTKDDYEVIKKAEDKFDIELDDKAKTFKIEPAKIEA